MKKKILVFITITTVILGFLSCTGEENNSTEKKEKHLTVKTYGNNNKDNDNKIIFTGDDIKSYNLDTREIIFNKEVSFGPSLPGKLIFSLNDNKLFEVLYVLPIASYLINDLVLHAPELDGKFYLQIGYPTAVFVERPDGSIGSNISAENIAICEENEQKRAKEWEEFIDWLKDTGKLIH